MADTDYKIVGTKMYIYPNTDTEQKLMNGLIAPAEGYTTYITVQNYYKTVEAQTGYESRLAQYDYYLQCVRVPEWASDAPTPPQPSYYDITVVDEYSTTHEIKTPSWQTITGEDVEAGSQLYFVLRSFDYEPSFDPELEVEKEPLPNGTGYSYGFVMPESDVTITIVEVQLQDYDITLVNEDSITVELYDGSWSTLDISQPISEGTVIQMMVGDYDYEATFSPSLEIEQKYWDSGNSRWYYQFVMPSNDLTVSIVEIPTVTLTVVNQDSRYVNWYDGANWYSDTHTAHVGANIDFICWTTSDKITFGSPIEYTEEFDSEGRYQYHFTLNDDLTVTTSARTGAGIYYDGNTNIEIQVGDTPTYPTLENPNSVTPITYSSSNTDLATVDSSGNVTLISNAIGEAYITATFEGDSTYDFSGTHFHIKVKDGYELRFVPKDSSMRFYNITKQEYIEQWGNAVRPSDEIFVTSATYNDKIQYKDGSNTWTTISFSIFDPITIDGEEVAGGKFTMPSSGVADGDYILVMDSSNGLYDISKNFEGNLYNDQLGDWWYDEEDQSNPGTYITKYPEGSNLGIESRSGETYTINPAQTQQQGGTVGMYIQMPSEAIEITKTN